jgi:hypothetical protein
MSDRNESFLYGFMIGGLTAFAIIFFITAGSEISAREKALEHGCAEFNSRTGEFQWKK